MNASGNKKLGKVRGAIRKGYLDHCTLEVHESILEITLAKKIASSHSTLMPFVVAGVFYYVFNFLVAFGAVDENSTCQYCGNKIMDVVVKK